MNRYCNWRSVGYLSSNGECFDIGITVATALDRYFLTSDPFAGDPDPRTAGNDALMRLAPVPMYFRASADHTFRFAGESTRTTHGAREAIKGSGYCVDSLEAALWCFFGTGSFEEAVLAAANLGGDADTTAAVCGQLAGAHYGVSSIPAAWLERLAMRGGIESLAEQLLEGSRAS